MDHNNLESSIQNIGKKIFSLIEGDKPKLWQPSSWEGKLFNFSMKNEEFKTQILRFIDVYPVLRGSSQIVRHLEEYLSSENIPASLKKGLALSEKHKAGDFAASKITEYIVNRMAHRFIAGSNVMEAKKSIDKIISEKMTFTIDLLGEKTTSELEADSYMNSYIEIINNLSEMLKNEKVNVSLKLSSLYSQFDPADQEGTAFAVKKRLKRIFQKAKSVGAFVNVDVETYDSLDITYKILKELLETEEFKDYENAGIVVQAYLKDSEKTIDSLIDWAEEKKHHIIVRLVKGAYWDYEIIHAKLLGWDIPTFTKKSDTDINYEKLTKKLLEHNAYVTTAIASHNVRSISKAIALAQQLQVPSERFELQVLYGMADSIKKSLVKIGYPPRNYIPYGKMIPGMGYLVRRMLENTSNDSFLRSFYYEKGVEIDDLLKNPEETDTSKSDSQQIIKENIQKDYQFTNEPVADYSKKEYRRLMKDALSLVHENFGKKYPLVIDGREVYTGEFIPSINPSKPSELVGEAVKADTNCAEQTINAAEKAAYGWSNTNPEERAGFLRRAASVMREKRFVLAAIEVFEAGKSWKEADADVCEAIDFLEYYAKEMVRLGKSQTTQDLPGEVNETMYIPRGIALIISPWNFPLAILTGMTSAAVVTGNTVIMKPASQTPIIAAELMNVFIEASIPKGVLNYLPGKGSDVGEYLINHPKVNTIAFTGSREVGLHIVKAASEVRNGQNHIKKVIAELGGKNPLIIDASADFDEAIPGIVISAFGYSGQKCSACSRIIVLESIYDVFVDRLIEAVKSIKVGDAKNPGTFVGPVIGPAAQENINEYINTGKNEGTLLYSADVSKLDGFFVGPTVIGDVPPDAVVAQEEIFGPVLAVIKVKDFDEAIRVANCTQYALTGGLYSRTPSHIERFKREIEVGNRYINKKITGAIVERQPFGGYKMSGIGSKAGGIDYLLQFMVPISVSENVMRHGFAPIKPEDI